MDEVVQLLQKLLPLLSVDLIEKTKDKFIEIGVNSVEDLQILKEQDLTDVLKPIQIRKLLQHCNAGVYGDNSKCFTINSQIQTFTYSMYMYAWSFRNKYFPFIHFTLINFTSYACMHFYISIQIHFKPTRNVVNIPIVLLLPCLNRPWSSLAT